MPCGSWPHTLDCTTLYRWTCLLVSCRYTGHLFVEFPSWKQYVPFFFSGERGPSMNLCSQTSVIPPFWVNKRPVRNHIHITNSDTVGVEPYFDPCSGISHFYSDCQGSWTGQSVSSEELTLDHRKIISSKLIEALKALSESWNCSNSLWPLRDYHIVTKKVAGTPAAFPDRKKGKCKPAMETGSSPLGLEVLDEAHECQRNG